jgi:hypothetical protein
MSGRADDLRSAASTLTAMDADEAAQREAEHKAAALFYLSWENGAGATIWARAVRDQLILHESARESFAAETADLETWERLHSTALIIVVAIDQVLAFERRIRRLTGDAELAQARARFDATVPDAEALRDLISHLDEYAVGQGWRQQGKGAPAISDRYLATFIYWADSGGTIVNLGDAQVNLRAAADAAVELAQVVERVRARHLERVEQEANAAARRRYGSPPE